MRALTARNLQQKAKLEVLRLHLREQLYVLFLRGREVLDLLDAPEFDRADLQVCGHRFEGQHHLLQLLHQSRSIPLANPLRSPKVARTNYTWLD